MDVAHHARLIVIWGLAMLAGDSITRWISNLKEGDHDAAQKIWEQYFARLVGLARKKMENRPRASSDEEDVALSAFDSFCRGAEQQRFPQLSDRHDLWQLLVVITLRKAADHANYHNRQKRGGGLIHKSPSLLPEEIPCEEPDPELAAMVADECEHLLAVLDDAELRRVALWKMEGFTNNEIAKKMGRARQTVGRKLRLIQNIWSKEIE